jgi:hypothetical protein
VSIPTTSAWSLSCNWLRSPIRNQTRAPGLAATEGSLPCRHFRRTHQQLLVP